MQAGFAVELGPDDETLEFPWSDTSSGVKYVDVKHHPELVSQVSEVALYPEVAEFLVASNSATSAFETAKCDVWFTTEMTVEDEVFGSPCKFGSYIDFLFSDPTLRASFSAHEAIGKQLTSLLRKVPDIPAAAEFFLRRCYQQGADECFYITFYLFGYAEDEPHARRQWAIGLKLVENVLRQLSTAKVSGPTP